MKRRQEVKGKALSESKPSLPRKPPLPPNLPIKPRAPVGTKSAFKSHAKDTNSTIEQSDSSHQSLQTKAVSAVQPVIPKNKNVSVVDKKDDKVKNSIDKNLKVAVQQIGNEDETEESSSDDNDNDDDDSENDDDDDDNDKDNGNNEDEENNDDSEDDEFEKQSSSDSEIESNEDDDEDDEIDRQAEEIVRLAELSKRDWKQSKSVGVERSEEINKSKESGEYNLQKVLNVDDLSSDDEDDEGRNTIGRIPLHWYDAYDHIGYNISGEKLVKRKGKDRIDQALSSNDPIASRTVYDLYNDREVVLSDRDLELIRRMKAGAFAHPEHDSMPEYVDYFSSIKEVMPLSAAPEPKRRFLPSKWELMKVMKIVKAMKEGKYVDIKTRREQMKDKPKDIYMIWNDLEDDILAESKRYQYHLPAPKMPLPGHAESYNPPAEYLLTPEELAEQEELDPKDRQYNFTPQKYSCLRHVPGYDNLVKERFERCLDLYLCPRKLKRRLNIDPEALVPKLPKPKDLKPFPNDLVLQYLGHTKAVRSISVSPDGQYIVSGSDDGTVRLWEVDTALCRYTWQLSKTEAVVQVAWNPHQSHHLVAAAVGSDVVLIATGTGDADSTEVTDALLGTIMDNIKSGNKNEEAEEVDVDLNDDEDEKSSKKKKSSAKDTAVWSLFVHEPPKSKKSVMINSAIGPRVRLSFKADVSKIVWHYKGDYLATLVPQLSINHQTVSVHQISKAKSQFPFTKSPGLVQTMSFHPSRPFLFIVTQQHVKVYHLVEQKMVKKLISGCKWISSVDIHPSGDHLIVGSYDRRVVWFDLDLSSTPYKTLKFHEKAIRDVNFHRRYPLMASASDDGTVHVFHSMVYNDLSKNAMIVPLKILRGHGVKGDLGVLSIEFHPRQPWLFSSGADGVINLFQDL